MVALPPQCSQGMHGVPRTLRLVVRPLDYRSAAVTFTVYAAFREKGARRRTRPRRIAYPGYPSKAPFRKHYHSQQECWVVRPRLANARAVASESLHDSCASCQHGASLQRRTSSSSDAYISAHTCCSNPMSNPRHCRFLRPPKGQSTKASFLPLLSNSFSFLDLRERSAKAWKIIRPPPLGPAAVRHQMLG